jgi:hypothetical protein
MLMMSNNFPLIIFVSIAAIALLIGAVFIYPITAGAIANDVVVPDTDITQEEEQNRQHYANEVIGSANSFVKVNFDDGSSEMFAQEEPFMVSITKPLSSSILSRDRTDRATSMKYFVNYEIDDFDIVEVSADIIVLACPLSEYCDEQGSPSSVIVCGDTTPCEIGFDQAVLFVVLDLWDFDRQNPDRLFQDSEDVRIVFKAEWINLKVQSKLDNTLYSATNQNLITVVDLPLDSSEIETNFSQDNGMAIDEVVEVKDFMDTDDIEIGDVVKHWNGDKIVANIEVCTGITNPPQPNQCTAGMCNYTYSNSRAETVRECS